MSNQEPEQAATHFRTKIILLAIIFLLPFGYAAYLKTTDWRPAETTNYGELVTPALSLNDVQMKTLDGKEPTSAFSRMHIRPFTLSLCILI